jgi:hypothetical protein
LHRSRFLSAPWALNHFSSKADFMLLGKSILGFLKAFDHEFESIVNLFQCQRYAL